jgi:hypothetical protein
VRAVFFLLLFVNLAFLAWAEWIDVPQPAPPNDVYAKLPRLKLVGEVAGDENRPSSGSARKTALEPRAQTSQCVSIGPFEDEPSAARGASMLQEKGFKPRQHAEQGEVSKGFWVYIGDLKTDREVKQVLLTLQQSHVDDAQLMPPDAANAQRVSVGIFSERERAERRAESLRKLSLEPQIAERKVPGTVFWVDVDVPVGGGPAPVAAALASSGAGANLGSMPCPNGSQAGGAAPLPPAPGTTTTFRTKVAGASEVP